jgi:hypothetical protein
MTDRMKLIPGEAERTAASQPKREPYVESAEPCGLPVADTILGPIHCQLPPGHDGVCQAWEWARDNAGGES